jgi:two-component system NarL family sensor kinase
VVLVVLATVAVLALSNLAVHEAIKQARELTETRTQFVVQPAVTDGLAAGDPRAVAAFDRVIREDVLQGRVVRVKIWSPEGRVLYSDERRQIGELFPLEADERDVLITGESLARRSDRNAAENKLNPLPKRLLEVYTSVETPSGEPLLSETYLQLDSVLAYSNSWMWALVPGVLIALVTLQLCQLPLAWRLIRRVQQGQREKEVLQRRAIEASDHERRRIAADLHDGLVQRLVSTSLSLSTAAGPLRASDQTVAADQLEAAADSTRESITQLRSLITDIYPTSLEQVGLRAALADLLAGAEKQGVHTELVVREDPQVPAEVTAALYRAAREAVRNVLRHAGASEVRVELVEGAHTIGVVVTDDGVGMADMPDAADPTHLGLRLLSDLAAEIDGRLSVSGRPEGGTCFRFELPKP